MNDDIAAKAATLFIALVASVFSANRPDRRLAKSLYVGAVWVLAVASFVFQNMHSHQEEQDKLALRIQQQATQAKLEAKLEEAKARLEDAKAQSQDCNARITGLNQRFLAASKALPKPVQKQVQAVSDHFERTIPENLHFDATVSVKTEHKASPPPVREPPY